MRLPRVEFQDTQGRAVTLDQPGMLYVLNFWATWCRPCQEELPELLAIVKKHAGSDRVRVMAINTEDVNDDRLSAFIERRGLGGLPVYRDRRSWYQDQGIATIPVTMLILNREVLARFDGYSKATMGKIEAAIRDHLK